MKIHRATDLDRAYFIARELAVDAVARICRPRKPIAKPGTEYHICPTCGGLLTEQYRHCRWCGQNLDWKQNDPVDFQ